MKIQYQEVSAREVMHYFAKAFEPKDGELKSFEWFYDPLKGVIVFKLYVEEAVSSSHGETEGEGT